MPPSAMPQQALQHGLQAKEILLSPQAGLAVPTAPLEGKTSIIWAFATIGHAYLKLGKQEEAEKALKRARREASRVSTLPMEEVPHDIQLRIAVDLGRWVHTVCLQAHRSALCLAGSGC